MTRPSTYRRAAYIRELASLGLWQTKIAELLDMEPVRVHQIGKQFGIAFSRKPNSRGKFHEAIRKGYAAGLSPAQIAERNGSTTASIRVTACRLGLTRTNSSDPAKYRRPFILPDHLRPQYRELRELGLTISEAGANLGLLQRDQMGAGQ